MDYLKQIAARAEKATEGPWKDDGDGGLYMNGVGAQFMGGIKAIRNARFAAHSRTDVPRLVAALEAVDALLTKRQQMWDAICAETCCKGIHEVNHHAIADTIATNIQSAIQEALQ